jgi:hypothetical protein
VSELDQISVEAILDDLYASEINLEISWLWDGGIDLKVGRRWGIDVKLGDPLNGYEPKGKVRSMAEAAVWLARRVAQSILCDGAAYIRRDERLSD